MRFTAVVLAGLATEAACSYEKIYGYSPNSKVTDHNALDMDQADLESALKEDPVNYAYAKAIYMNGGHSKSYMTTSAVSQALTNSYTTSAVCTGTDADGNTVTGKLKSALTSGGGPHTISCYYSTSESQENYQSCQEGALQGDDKKSNGCFQATSDIVISEGALTDTVLAANIGSISNANDRTLRGFGTATTTDTKMWSGCAGCPYDTYSAFYKYYGTHSYMDDYVMGGLDGTNVEFASNSARSYTLQADFLTYNDDSTRVDSIKKGTAFMHVWMYTIREFEDAIDDCSTSSLDNNYDGVHAWDEGVAFYTGSLELADGSGSGKMIAALADKRCPQYGTCGDDGVTAKVNEALLEQFRIGRNALMVLDCGAVRPVVERIIQLMTVPLVQGTLRYAYYMGTFGPGGSNTNAAGSANLLKQNAEGATFAFAVLPLVHQCSPVHAKTIYDNMKLGAAATTDKMAVKAAFEAVYPCLGITCAEVGALNTAGGLYAGETTGFGTACFDGSTSGLTDAVVYQKIAGFTPRSKVTDHNALDLDQKALESQLALRSDFGFTSAKAIYENGGNSKAYARITVPGTDVNGDPTPALAAGTAVSAANADGGLITGSLKSDADAGATSYDIYYDTNIYQANYNGGCQVGGLNVTTTRGCIAPGTTVVIGWTAVNPSAIENKADRTLKGFATTSTTTEKMYNTPANGGCAGCPYDTFLAFYDYYGELDYGDKYCTAALDGTSLTFPSTTAAPYTKVADFGTYNDAYTRVDAAKKGTAFLNVWMYVIREFEDAVDDCTTTSLDNNYDAAHAWDEGVAFYTGSLEGVDGSGSGKMIYALAEKRCPQFGTCVSTDGLSGNARVNVKLFEHFGAAQQKLYIGDCDVRALVDRVIQLMTVPLIQGTLRYAYYMGKQGPGGDGTNAAGSNTLLKQNAEGATFAFAVLPLVHKCDATHAKTIYDNMMIGAAATTDHVAVKAAFEAVYPCLGLTCADIGALNVAGGLVAGDAWGTVCTDPDPSAESSVVAESSGLDGGVIAAIIVGVVAVVLFLLVVCMYRAEKAGTPIFTSIDNARVGNKPGKSSQSSAVSA